jgi:hypothetical protein
MELAVLWVDLGDVNVRRLTQEAGAIYSKQIGTTLFRRRTTMTDTDTQTVTKGAQLPQPAELVDSAFDFVGQLLAVQRQFAHDVLQAATPVTGPAEKTAN